MKQKSRQLLLLLTTSYLLPATYHLLTCYYLLPSIYYMQAVADRRLQDEQRSSNNSKTRAVAAAATEAAAAACSTVEQLVQKLERARQLRGSGALQEVERCEAELEAARAELEVSRTREARANSEAATLRRNQSAAEVTRLREAKAAEEARARVAEKSVKQHKAHLEVVEEEREAAALVARRAAKAHTVALQRGRDARAETKAVQRERDALAVELSTKDAKLDAMAVELAREQVAALHRQAEADVRLSEVCARLEAGDARARQMKQELEGLQEQLEANAKDAASKHAVVEEKLRDSQSALEAYQNFQAKENGAYKDSVRLCYYALIDKKVPTNQLEAVVTEVLKMVGVKAKALPKRATAQNMRREMGHVADVVAGLLLAQSDNVCGASDDTTKRQRTLAADLAHFRLNDGSLRTLCIGLSCMSRGTANAKVDRYSEKLAQAQAAARLSVPEFYGDVAAFDRVTLLDLIKCWCSDRCITERNCAKLVEERKAKEARAREGARQLAALRTPGCRLRLSVGVGGRVGCAVAVLEGGKPLPEDAAKLAELETAGRQAVAATMEQALPAATERDLVDAEMARALGGVWWLTLCEEERERICCVWAATCNAHRGVNIGHGFDEGLKEAFNAIKAEQEAADAAGAAAAGTPVAAPAPGAARAGGKGGAPWDQLIWEATKLLCMNARKMNVAIGQDLLGQQVSHAHTACGPRGVWCGSWAVWQLSSQARPVAGD